MTYRKCGQKKAGGGVGKCDGGYKVRAEGKRDSFNYSFPSLQSG